MVTLVELHDRMWRNLQKDKHHCNTPSIWALWQCSKIQSSLQCRHMKTHLEFAKKHLMDPQTVRNNILWFDEPQFQASCLKETRLCSSPAENHPKVKSAGSSLMWGCFSAAGTEGLVRVEKKLNAPKYRDSLNENPIQSIQNLRRAEGLPSNRTMDLNTQQEWLIDNSLEKPENVRLPPSNLTELERGRMRRRIADNCQMLMSKACRIKQKRLEAVKASAKYLVKGVNTYAMYLFQFFFICN